MDTEHVMPMAPVNVMLLTMEQHVTNVLLTTTRTQRAHV